MVDLIKAVVAKYAEGVTGKLGIYFKDLKNGCEYGYNDKEVFPAASVFKIFILAELFRQIREGKISLADRIALIEDYKSEGSGVLKEFDLGANLTVADYALLMMIISDNTATDLLIDLLGIENIQENVVERLDLNNTKCDLNCSQLISLCYGLEEGDDIKEKIKQGPIWLNNTPAYTGNVEKNDETSPYEVGVVLEKVFRNKWMGEELDKEMIGILSKCQTNSRIPKYLPKYLEIAHKTGTMDRVANDAGIVFTEKGSYILAVFYNGNTAQDEEYRANEWNLVGEELIAQMSKEIYNIYTS
ncbi:MAG: serine hydrolase [Synergistaceae bacterium]|nr:serine hydrolase [Synergistaceae bacterium]